MADPPAPILNNTPARPASRGTVLIVDDDPAVLDMLQLLFDTEGHHTLAAADGHQALELASKEAAVPDLIIADYNLPKGLNGLQTIARLQEQAQHAIPAVILTGDISTKSLLEIAAQGCVHLSKPVRAKELTRHAQRLIATARSAGSNGAQQSPLGVVADKDVPTIFVVDDDHALRETMRDLLNENGYPVEMFADGVAFLKAYRPERARCLLIDVLMPGN